MTDIPPEPGDPLDPNTPPPPPPKKKGQSNEKDNAKVRNADESESATSGTEADSTEANE